MLRLRLLSCSKLASRVDKIISTRSTTTNQRSRSSCPEEIGGRRQKNKKCSNLMTNHSFTKRKISPISERTWFALFFEGFVDERKMHHNWTGRIRGICEHVILFDSVRFQLFLGVNWWELQIVCSCPLLCQIQFLKSEIWVRWNWTCWRRTFLTQEFKTETHNILKFMGAKCWSKFKIWSTKDI